MGINKSRIWIGGFAGGVVWVIWSSILGMGVLAPRYPAVQNAGLFLKESRYPFFVGQWIIMLFVLAIILSHLYAWTRATLSPGPGTAIKVGFLVGFAAGFPLNFGTAAWSTLPRIFPLIWMLDMWVGAILATLVAGYFYRE
jgi:hypothetical protein